MNVIDGTKVHSVMVEIHVYSFASIMKINKDFLAHLFEQAQVNPRLRQNYDLRTSERDHSQRMLNALLPGTVVPIHRHPQSTENVFLLCGKLVEVVYDNEGNETDPHPA